MPAYNEADGLPGFIAELREHLAPLAEKLSFVVADDCSTDGTPDVLRAMPNNADVTVEVQPANRGHGPTALAAYRSGLALNPDVLVHVDGDGQFLGADFPRVLAALPGNDVVHGVRQSRTDPWFRKVITAGVTSVVSLAAGRRVVDVNTPLRAYQPEALRALLDALPADAEVPHVHFSLGEARGGFAVANVPVQSIARRGESATGTMWGAAPKPKLPPKRLRSFVSRARKELWELSLRKDAPMRCVSRPEPATASRG